VLSLSHSRTAAQATQYFAEHLVAKPRYRRHGPEDHFADEGAPGHWRGRGAAVQGLVGEVTVQDFAGVALAVSRDGRRLAQGAGKLSRRAGWDLVFSSPKSVSVAWGLGDDRVREAIGRAHGDAVDRALGYVETEARVVRSRRGKGGRINEAASAVIATFGHGTSRAADPDLHSHCFIFNLSGRDDGTWGTIDSRHFFRAKMAIGALYRAQLAAALQSLGYGIVRDHQSFRLASSTREQDLVFSRRRRQIVALLAARGRTTAAAAEVAALQTRTKKQPIDRATLIASWRARGAAVGITPATIRNLSGYRFGRAAGRGMPSHNEILRELKGRSSPVSRWQLETAVYRAAQGVTDADQAREYLGGLESDPALTRLRDAGGHERFTIGEIYDSERNLGELSRSQHDKRRQTHQTHRTHRTPRQKALDDRPTID